MRTDRNRLREWRPVLIMLLILAAYEWFILHAANLPADMLSRFLFAFVIPPAIILWSWLLIFASWIRRKPMEPIEAPTFSRYSTDAELLDRDRGNSTGTDS
jgi:hypothetical protein